VYKNKFVHNQLRGAKNIFGGTIPVRSPLFVFFERGWFEAVVCFIPLQFHMKKNPCWDIFTEVDVPLQKLSCRDEDISVSAIGASSPWQCGNFSVTCVMLSSLDTSCSARMLSPVIGKFHWCDLDLNIAYLVQTVRRRTWYEKSPFQSDF
jgi:hypothetical protein